MRGKSFQTVFKAIMALQLACLLLPLSPARASITSLTEVEFLDLAPEGFLYTDTLETYVGGQYEQPLELVNGQFRVDFGSPVIESLYRGADLTNVLSGTSIIGGRTFTLFPDSTVAWATDLTLQSVGLGPQEFEVTVVGNSGTATFLFEKNDFNPYFASFYDPSGLISVEFNNLGFTIDEGTQFSNYDFDDIMTLSRVPLPSAIWMFATGLFPLALFFCRRLIKNQHPAPNA
jgi:hypothetical protein